MKSAIHDNVNPFLGISFNEKEELLVVWKFCNRFVNRELFWKFEKCFPSNIIKLNLSSEGFFSIYNTEWIIF